MTARGSNIAGPAEATARCGTWKIFYFRVMSEEICIYLYMEYVKHNKNGGRYVDQPADLTPSAVNHSSSPESRASWSFEPD